MPCKLSVNVNAIAYLRKPPRPAVALGRSFEPGGAGCRRHRDHRSSPPDERHIRRSDVTVLRKMLRQDYPGAEFNIEGFPDARFLALVEEEKPDQVTLVPDDPSQGTSDHGWDIAGHRALLTQIIARLHKGGMRVSLFIDPDPSVPALAKEVGADRVEIYTGPYGGAFTPDALKREFDRVVATGKAAEAEGLGLNAGHDLTRENLPRLVAALPNLLEVRSAMR